MKRRMALLGALLLFGWTGVWAQSLAEIAKKEKDRRKKIAAAQVRSYDDSALRTRRAGRLTAAAPSPQPAPTASGEQEGAEPSESQGEQEPEPTRTESYWRNRLTSIDQRIAEIRGRLNAPGFSRDPSNFMRRQRLEGDLERAIAEREAVVEEARRKGVPPGWLR